MTGLELSRYTAASVMVHIGPHDHVFVLTGAGISAESGIPTFRGTSGLWKGRRVDEVASPEAWARNPEQVWQFYSERREVALKAEPNPAHFALAELERALNGRLFLCSQNVDDLHERGGSQRVVHMHGKLFQSRCEVDRCLTRPFDDRKLYRSAAEIPKCECGGRIRPHICWFGEVPFDLELIYRALDWCSIFVTIGSSGVVEPAASFVAWVNTRAARDKGAIRTVYVGAEEPANRMFFTDVFLGNAGDIVPKLFQVEAKSSNK